MYTLNKTKIGKKLYQFTIVDTYKEIIHKQQTYVCKYPEQVIAFENNLKKEVKELNKNI